MPEFEPTMCVIGTILVYPLSHEKNIASAGVCSCGFGTLLFNPLGHMNFKRYSQYPGLNTRTEASGPLFLLAEPS